MSLVELSNPRSVAAEQPSPLFLRLRVLVHRGRLDRQLANGGSAATDPRLALRATQLTRPALRAALATTLRRDLRSIEEGTPTRFPRPEAPVDAASVRACAPELRDLARALTDTAPGARSVAITKLLITDGSSPLYVGGQADQLRDTLLAARAAL